MKKQKMWLFAGIILSVLIISGSISYAFFTASITHNNQEAMVITSGNMRLTYDDGNDNISLENALPGTTITKQFSVENTGDITTTYGIFFSELLNTFIDQSDLVYTLSSTEASIDISESQLPDTSDEIISNIVIFPTDKHNYTLTIKFLNKDEDQNDNQGKKFQTKIGINDMKYYPVATLLTGYDFNNAVKNIVNGDDYCTYGGCSDANVTTFVRSNTLDETKNNVIVSEYSSPYPVYVWYDEVDNKGIVYLYSEAEIIYMNSDSDGMFNSFESLESLDLSIFDSSKVTSMSNIFSYSESLASLDLSSFNTSRVTNMSYMFSGLDNITSIVFGNDFNTSRVTNMSDMFAGTRSLSSINLSKFNTSNVTDMSYMFSYSGLTSIDLSSFDTSRVTNMSYMFSNLENITSLDLSSLNTSSVTNMECMFYDMSSITSLDVSTLNTSNVTNMAGMFSGMESLTSLDVSTFNTSKVTNMFSTFASMSDLTSINLGNMDTSKVTKMGGMFAYDVSLEVLDISSFSTASVTDFLTGIISSSYISRGMFEWMLSLKTIYVGSNWDVSSFSPTIKIFDSNPLLVGGAGTHYSYDHSNMDYAHVDGGVDNPGYLTLKTNN